MEPADTDVRKFMADSGIEERTARRWQSLATHITGPWVRLGRVLGAAAATTRFPQ